jgi:hypothetical protein
MVLSASNTFLKNQNITIHKEVMAILRIMAILRSKNALTFLIMKIFGCFKMNMKLPSRLRDIIA